MDKKKILFISLWIIIGIMLIINIVIFNKEDKNSTVKSKTVELLEVFEMDKIENGKYETVKNKNIEVANKYLSNNNKYELNVNVKFEEDEGRLVYIREGYEKVNIFYLQTTIFRNQPSAKRRVWDLSCENRNNFIYL